MKNLSTLFIIICGLFLLNPSYAHEEHNGHCNYNMKNQWLMPGTESLKVCEMPTDEVRCQKIANIDENFNAVQSKGVCSMEGAVGTCVVGDKSTVYYESNSMSLKIGCGFENGEWTTAE